MRNYSMTEHEALNKIHPRTLKDRKSLWTIIGFLAFALITATAIFVLRQMDQEKREQTWQSTIATIEDVRPVIVSQVESQRGGAMLYQLEILIRYTANGIPQSRWTKVPQPPMSLESAQLDAARWKGQKCFVRWRTTQPDQIEAEVN
jgi:hypothetical protein